MTDPIEPQGPTVDRYYWAAGARIPVAAAVAAVEFERIRRVKRHGVRPADIVEAAQPADAKLHACFEWDTDAAAVAYREEQARYLLRSLIVVYRKADDTLAPPTRGMVRVLPRATDPALDLATEEVLEPRTYIPVRTMLTEPEIRRRYVEQAWRAVVAWRQRYHDIAELARIFAAIDEEIQRRKAG